MVDGGLRVGLLLCTWNSGDNSTCEHGRPKVGLHKPAYFFTKKYSIKATLSIYCYSVLFSWASPIKEQSRLTIKRYLPPLKTKHMHGWKAPGSSFLKKTFDNLPNISSEVELLALYFYSRCHELQQILLFYRVGHHDHGRRNVKTLIPKFSLYRSFLFGVV